MATMDEPIGRVRRHAGGFKRHLFEDACLIAAGNFPFLAGLLLAFLVAGCSSFNRDWKKAALQPPPPNSIEGRWDGSWLSSVNGHNGSLRCLITRQSNDVYSARFQATYQKVLRFGYTVPLTVTRSNDAWTFHGEANLGALAGGVYRYRGSATSVRFHSIYTSKFDSGDFEMTRPKGAAADGQIHDR